MGRGGRGRGWGHLAGKVGPVLLLQPDHAWHTCLPADEVVPKRLAESKKFSGQRVMQASRKPTGAPHWACTAAAVPLVECRAAACRCRLQLSSPCVPPHPRLSVSACCSSSLAGSTWRCCAKARTRRGRGAAAVAAGDADSGEC